ncbi:MAG: hypothetical protein HY317_03100 [Acidobacteria bacterium]|nr:hypothetical protein [Acidobacteriota bacterium]
MRSHASVALVALLAGACQRDAAGTPPPPTPVEEGKALLGQGQLDAALAKFQQAGSQADGLYYQGVVWARKAEIAPLPTPPPTLEPLPRGTEPPPAPEFKPEELTALDLYEKALAARADHPQAHLGVAELLGPHAAHRHDLEEAAKQRRPARKGRAPEPTPPPAAEGPDFSVERVLKHYQIAVQGDPRTQAPVDALLRFAQRVGRLVEAEGALQEMTRREPERPEPFIRYGDFLANEKKDPQAAVEQYKQALVWRAEDDTTRSKIAEIYITQGVEHWKIQQYATAQARFLEAQKWITDKNSPQGLKLQDYVLRLRELRPPR